MKREIWERTLRGEYAEDEVGSVMSLLAMMPPPLIIIEESYRDDCERCLPSIPQCKQV